MFIERELKNITGLMSKYFGEDDTINDTSMDTLTKIITLMLECEYAVKFKLKPEYANELKLSTQVIELKNGNNGGFKFVAQSSTKVTVLLHIQISGVQVTLALPLKDLLGIYVSKDETLLAEMRDLITIAYSRRYLNIINHDIVEAPEQLNVVSMADFKRKR